MKNKLKLLEDKNHYIYNDIKFTKKILKNLKFTIENINHINNDQYEELNKEFDFIYFNILKINKKLYILEKEITDCVTRNN